MSKVIEGNFDGRGMRLGIVVARFNSSVTTGLLAGATDACLRHGIKEAALTVVKVPGAFEIPLATKLLASQGRVDGIIGLGAVIRGETAHFDFVASEAAKGIAQTMLASELPIGFGVLTTDLMDQAMDRAGNKSGNKGFETAMHVIEMISLKRQILDSSN